MTTNGETRIRSGIYLLPNLMTAGNLLSGFMAVLQIIHAALAAKDADSGITAVAGHYQNAVWLILAACLFDVLDGRLARLGGQESPFGKEFDSLADIVSFGVAPALLVYQLVLRDFDKLGTLVASLYLVCGALRLARFNTAKPGANCSNDFVGFPIPAAAGVIASLTLLMLWLDRGSHTLGPWKYALAGFTMLLSFLMFSRLRYPSFKSLDWQTTRSPVRFLGIIGLLFLTAQNPEWMPAIIFCSYLLYGLIRPFLGPITRRKIEEEPEPPAAAS